MKPAQIALSLALVPLLASTLIVKAETTSKSGGGNGSAALLGGNASTDLYKPPLGEKYVREYLLNTLKVEDVSRIFLSDDVRKQLIYGFKSTQGQAFQSDGSLTPAAREALLGQFSAMSKEALAQILRALGRESYANAMLVGPAGVGKSFLLKQLVNVLSLGVVPEFLEDELGLGTEDSPFLTQFRNSYFHKTQIVTVDYDLLSLDNTRSGQAFAKADVRMRTILIELFDAARKDFQASGTRTVFVLEEVAHLPPLVQQTLKKRLDPTGFKTLSKDPIERGGEVGYSVIGITTPGELRAMIQADSAVERRYQRVPLFEPTDEQALDILSKKKEGWLDRFGLLIEDDVLAYLISMRKYFGHPPLAMPDSVIKVASGLMEWASNPKNRKHGQEITTEEAYDFLIRQSHLPRDVWMGDPAHKRPPLYDLGDRMKKLVIGQDDAVERIASRIKASRISGFRQLPVFILMGPSGSGKDTIVNALNRVLFGHDGAHFKFDLSGARGSDLKAIIEGPSLGSASDSQLPLLAQAMDDGPPFGAVAFNEIKDTESSQFNLLKTVVEDGVIRPRGRDTRERPLGLNVIFLMGQYGEELFEGKSDEEVRTIMSGLTERHLIEILQRGKDGGRSGAMPYALIQRAIRTGGIVLIPPVPKNKYPDIVRLNLKNILDNLRLRAQLNVTVDDSLVNHVADLAIQGGQGPRGLDGILADLTETVIAEAMEQGLPERGAYVDLAVSSDKAWVHVRHLNTVDGEKVYPVEIQRVLRIRCGSLLSAKTD